MSDAKNIWGDELAAIMAQSRLVYSYDDINRALEVMAEKIALDLAGRRPLALTVMQGGLMFAAHLLARLPIPVELDYVHASRYRGKLQGADLEWIARPSVSLEGRDILLLDDIFDQGYTLEHLVRDCKEQGAASVRSAVLLTKNHERDISDYRPDYSALSVEDLYVFGFGMDFEHQLRNLNGIYAYEPHT